MENQPLVSVILPAYNKEKYIKRAVESVLNQTYKNIEIIIIDDKSTDKTPEVISKLSQKDPSIIILTNKVNLGLTRTLNKGIKVARGKYIARLDDEDFWCDKKKLEKQVDFLEKNTEYGLVGGGAIEVDQEGRKIMRYLLSENDEDIRKVILFSTPFVHVAVLFRKDIWEKTGGYNEELDGSEDIDLWLKIGKLSKFYNFQEFFACYIGHDYYKNPGYLYKKHKRLEILKREIKLKKKYRHDYPGYKKAVLLCLARFFYSFLFFKQKSHPAVLKFKKIIFGSSVFKKIEKL